METEKDKHPPEKSSSFVSRDPIQENHEPGPDPKTNLDPDQDRHQNHDIENSTPSEPPTEPEPEPNPEATEEEEENKEEEETDATNAEESHPPPNFNQVCEEIDRFISVLSRAKGDESDPPDVSEVVEQFAFLVEAKISNYDPSESTTKWIHLSGDDSCSFLESVDRVSKLTNSLCEFSSESKYAPSINRIKAIQGPGEINELMGDTWLRKWSSDLRQYHKNYQRETWGRLLSCLSHEGLIVHGKVVKPVLKEQFKSFNAMFDEIHKTQSVWVVSDEQLQSELRVSISSVVISAYWSFLARFSQNFTTGRQTEKYIKYQPEDIETFIDELFDGNATPTEGRNHKHLTIHSKTRKAAHLLKQRR
ncbi:exocyst subunit exo70 family protein C1 [Actinidia rufa]|uniref:Exocyst subunit Exo70 family protein n=1 Tax=Actinidia rufa TaxID=165716 RepID=A0A7J0EFG9_9ERIC|nr:exocyst subunit exo70 family protein C1 [Actinidia rufa]